MTYKTPPQKHQFQKGQSGNPKGRPIIAKRYAIEIAEYLFVLIGNKQKIPRSISIRLSEIHSILKRLVEKESK